MPTANTSVISLLFQSDWFGFDMTDYINFHECYPAILFLLFFFFVFSLFLAIRYECYAPAEKKFRGVWYFFFISIISFGGGAGTIK